VRRLDMAKLSDAEIAELMPQVAGWSVVEEEGMKRLQREFTFGDFAEALAFTNSVGELAESANHHPRITTEWGRVTLTWWSHDQGGMVAADIDMAKKLDAL
jgi:4a-hydroxytetrahydrobiopterin dehydratase